MKKEMKLYDLYTPHRLQECISYSVFCYMLAAIINNKVIINGDQLVLYLISWYEEV